MSSPPTLAEIEARCKIVGSCLVWTGFVNRKDGRPFWHRNRKDGTPLRRIVLEHRMGEPLQPGWYAGCTCETPGCIEHAKAMTRGQIMRQSAARGGGCGEKHSIAQRKAKRKAAPKMTEERAAEMRAMRAEHKTPYTELARIFGVHTSMAHRICLGKAWAPLPPAVKKTVIPTPPGRFAPDDKFQGAITADWYQRVKAQPKGNPCHPST